MGGGGAATRALHGSIAAAAAVLASAAATVDIPDKLHLKATPILFYAVPMSMPLPPLPSVAPAISCFESKPLSLSLSRILPPKDGAMAPLPTPSSLSPSCSFTGVTRDTCAASLLSPPPSSSSSSPYFSSSFSLAQGAPGVSTLSSTRQTLSYLFPSYLASGVLLHPALSHGLASPCMGMPQPPLLSLHPFLTSSFPGKNSSGAAAIGRSLSTSFLYPSSLQTASFLQAQFDSPMTLAKLSAQIAQTHSTTYLESLLSTLSAFQFSPPFSTNPPFSTFSQSLHTWHTPMPNYHKFDKKDDSSTLLTKKPALTVVLLGWLGSQQKHLKKYAEWYNARGIHAVTFVVPMTDILSFQPRGKAEEHVDALAHQLALWLSDQGEHANVEGEKQLMFHTFSNTGWLTYGVVLEKLQERGEHLLGRIKGCVVDSAPAPDPDPQVWASGFSAALLKKRSSATKPGSVKGEMKEGVSVEGSNEGSLANSEVEPHGMEAAVLSVLEGFFSLFLKLPAINQRLSEVVTILQKKQPPCPQLYIYSTADRVIPVKAVEAFIEQQRKAGRVVRACNLQSSPHVDHFRSHPQLYSDQLSNFLKELTPSTNQEKLN